MSPRVKKLLAEAAELQDVERAELVTELARTVPGDLSRLPDDDAFSEEWTAEIKRRLADENDRGEALTFDELRARIDVMASPDE